MSAPPFDPNFRDDLPAPEAFDIPLFLPAPIPRTPDRSIWVRRVPVLEEDLFGERLVHRTPRHETVVLLRSTAAKGITLVNSNGTPLETPMPDLVQDIISPPRAWMSDSAMERSMMYHPALLARGDVLIGGLGLAIYPQFVLHLARPVTSLTIVDNSPEILQYVGEPWVKSLGRDAPPVVLVEDTIESYLSSSQRTFDTIYLDTWGDLHWRLLAAINHLIWLSRARLREGGQIQAWGFWHLRRSLVELAVELERTPDIWPSLDTSQSPTLDAYLRWRKAQPQGPLAEQEIVAKATEMAETIRQPGGIESFVDLPRFGTRGRLPL